MKNIDVYFRDNREGAALGVDPDRSYPFCTTTAAELDGVIPLIRSWGFYSDQPDLFGQFVIVNDRLAFEVVAADD